MSLFAASNGFALPCGWLSVGLESALAGRNATASLTCWLALGLLTFLNASTGPGKRLTLVVAMAGVVLVASFERLALRCARAYRGGHGLGRQDRINSRHGHARHARRERMEPPPACRYGAAHHRRNGRGRQRASICRGRHSRKQAARNACTSASDCGTARSARCPKRPRPGSQPEKRGADRLASSRPLGPPAATR